MLHLVKHRVINVQRVLYEYNLELKRKSIQAAIRIVQLVAEIAPW